MGSTGALAAIVVLVSFLSGIPIGVITIVSLASRGEDARYSLDGEAPSATYRGVRRLVGAWVRGPGFRPMGWVRQDSGRDTWTRRRGRIQ